MADDELDSIRDFNKGLDMVFQEIQDREDQDLFDRVRKVGYYQSEQGVRNFIRACREEGLEEGMTIAEARADGDRLLNWALDARILDEYLNVKSKRKGRRR